MKADLLLRLEDGNSRVAGQRRGSRQPGDAAADDQDVVSRRHLNPPLEGRGTSRRLVER
jgi:hypothetical protein